MIEIGHLKYEGLIKRFETLLQAKKKKVRPKSLMLEQAAEETIDDFTTNRAIRSSKSCQLSELKDDMTISVEGLKNEKVKIELLQLSDINIMSKLTNVCKIKIIREDIG